MDVGWAQGPHENAHHDHDNENDNDNDHASDNDEDGDDDDNNEPGDEQGHDDAAHDEDDDGQQHNDGDDEAGTQDDSEYNNNDDGEEAHGDDDDEGAHDDSDEGARNDSNEGAHDAPETEQGATAQSRYNLRERTAVMSDFKTAMDNPHDGQSYFPPTQLTQRSLVDKIKYICGKVMTQKTAKQGIKQFGQEAVAALMQEFSQLEDLTAYEAVDAGLLTRAQWRAALRAINLIKRKRNGKLKGRTVADGSMQRSLYDKSETTSPTVSTDALLLLILIDAHEGRDVATADIAGAYLKAFMDDLVIMKFTEETVDILCKMNPKHAKFVVVENAVKVL